MTRKTEPSSVWSSSSTRTMPGWLIMFATYPSRVKRLRMLASTESC
ncbi:MAG: hypothetical protein IPG50_08210 [Myxococcales bacterium]|nr:hypothetical protein [Myxococcales bacterium]